MELINNFVVTLVTTLIFITAIEIIGPDNSMKKYLKFVLGLILIAVLLTPIINFFSKGEEAVTAAIDKYEKQINNSSIKDKTTNDKEKLREESFKDNLNKNCVSLLSDKFKDYNFKSEIKCNMNFTDMTFTVNEIKIGIQKKGVKDIEQIDLDKEKSKGNDEDSIQKAVKKYLSEEIKVEEKKVQVYYL